MQANTKRTVNYVFYTGKDEFEANTMVQNIFGAEPNNGVLTVESDNEISNVFLRWTGGLGFTNPIGVTDVLIVHVPSDTTSTEEIEAYVDARAGVPVKIVLSNNESLQSWEASKGFRYTGFQTDVRNFATEGLNAFEERLQGAFNKYNTEGTGITAEQFVQVAQELGVDTNSEGFTTGAQVNFIAQPRLSYSRFRQWWIFGRNEPELWSRFMSQADQIQAAVSAKIGEISKIFETVSGETTQELSHRAKIEIHSTEPFNESSSFGWELLTGEKFDEANTSNPFSVRNSPFTLSFEIGINDPSVLEHAITVLNQFKEMLKMMVPDVSLAVKLGLDLQFRSSDGRFFFDFVVSGLLGGVIQENLSRVNFQLIKYAGLTNFSISTQASPLNALDKSLEELIRNLCYIAISSGGEVVNTKTVLRIVQMILSSIQGSNNSFSKDFNTVLGFINAFKGLFFDIKFAPGLLFEAVRDAINIRSKQNDKFGILSERWTQTQEMFNGFVEQGKMFSGFVTDYVPLLKNINLDNLQFTFTFPYVRTSFRIYLRLSGITEFINQNFLA